MRGEGGSLEITVATGKEAREPKTYFLLVVGQTIVLLSHVTQLSNGLAVNYKKYVAGSIPGSDKNEKMGKVSCGKR